MLLDTNIEFHTLLFPFSQANYFARLHTRPGENCLVLCAGVGSDMLGAFMHGLNVVGVELDENQCVLAGQRFDLNASEETREVIEPVMPLPKLFEFYKAQKEFVTDVVQEQRNLAASLYEEYRESLPKSANDLLPPTDAVLAQEGPEDVSVQYALGHFDYAQIKEHVMKLLIPHLPSGMMFDELFSKDFLARVKRERLFGKPTGWDEPEENEAAISMASTLGTCIACGEAVPVKTGVRCDRCKAPLCGSSTDEPCFVMEDDKVLCTKDCSGQHD